MEFVSLQLSLPLFSPLNLGLFVPESSVPGKSFGDAIQSTAV